MVTIIDVCSTIVTMLYYRMLLLFVKAGSVENMVKVCKTVESYCCTCRAVVLVFRNALVICISFCMPDFVVAEVIAFMVCQTETEGRYTVHCEICMV